MKILFLFLSLWASSADLSEGSKAPLFETNTHEGKGFSLAALKGRWTVLYFFPKADTPGCTKQACAFRDSVDKIKALKADVYGISTDGVPAQAAFHKKNSLNYVLLSDSDARITGLYGSKMPVLNMSKRWTYIIDPDLVVRSINKNVDPEKDPDQVVETLKKLQFLKSK